MAPPSAGVGDDRVILMLGVTTMTRSWTTTEAPLLLVEEEDGGAS